MKKNMGAIDRTIRVVVAIVLGLLYFLGVVQGTLATVLLVVAILFLVTSAASVCPGYVPLGISTRKGE